MTIADEQIKKAIAENVAAALTEDIGSGDLTAQLVDAEVITGATIISRESLVVCGMEWVNAVFASLDERIVVDWYVGDGQNAASGDVLCKLVGPARAILSGERAALNFLQTLSATATLTADYVQRIDGTGARILDTRKTLPGLRIAQKYAVTCGGGHNHRVGLYDAILIKENHIKSAGSIRGAMQQAQGAGGDVLIEVEVETQDELIEALDAGATRILLDNFSLEALREAVEKNAAYGYARAELEASGNVSLDTVRAIAETGVDYISSGDLTKNIRAADLSMLFRID